MAGQQIGRLGQTYIEVESAYGTPATFDAADAIRLIDIGTSNSNNRANSEEKKGTPGLSDRFSRHITAGFDIRRAYLSPSGTLGVAPEAKKVIHGGFGAERLGTGSTTVDSGASSTVFDVATGDGADFAVGEVIGVRRVANASRVEPRRITAIAVDTITVSPALGGTPASGDTVVAGVTYSLANNLPHSLTVGRYLPDLTLQINGCAVEKLGFTFDGNGEVMFKASGPGKDKTRPAQTKPGAFTTVGSPLTGLVGAFLLNGTAYKITKCDIEIANSEELVNDEFGTDRASDMYRGGRRDITLAVEARVTDDVTILAAAEAAGDQSVVIHAGNTAGRVIAAVLPRVEWDEPEVPDGDGALRWSYRGVGKETLGNDEIVLAFL